MKHRLVHTWELNFVIPSETRNLLSKLQLVGAWVIWDTSSRYRVEE